MVSTSKELDHFSVWLNSGALDARTSFSRPEAMREIKSLG